MIMFQILNSNVSPLSYRKISAHGKILSAFMHHLQCSLETRVNDTKPNKSIDQGINK